MHTLTKQFSADLTPLTWHTLRVSYGLNTAGYTTLTTAFGDAYDITYEAETVDSAGGPFNAINVGIATGFVDEFAGVRFDDFVVETYYDESLHPDCDQNTHSCMVFLAGGWDEDPGCGWTEEAGDWNSISTTDDDAILRSSMVSPRINSHIQCDIQFQVSNLDVVLRFYIGWIDEDNYWFAEYDLAGGVAGAPTLKLYERAGGVNTQLGPTASVAQMTETTSSCPACAVAVTFCLGNGLFSCYIGGDPRNHFPPFFPSGTLGMAAAYVTPPAEDSYTAVGTGAIDGTVTFTLYRIQQVNDDVVETCFDCVENCTYCNAGTYPFDGIMVSVPEGTFSETELCCPGGSIGEEECGFLCDNEWDPPCQCVPTPPTCEGKEGEFLCEPTTGTGPPQCFPCADVGVGQCIWKHRIDLDECCGDGVPGYSEYFVWVVYVPSLANPAFGDFYWEVHLVSVGVQAGWWRSASIAGTVLRTSKIDCSPDGVECVDVQPFGSPLGSYCQVNDSVVTITAV